MWAKTSALEDNTKATTNLYNGSVTLTYYPSSTSGFFVKGGAGLAVADVDFVVAGKNVTVEIGTGPGLLAGAGYDLRVARRISVTPAVNVWYGNLTDISFFNNKGPSKHNVVDFTLGITFH